MLISFSLSVSVSPEGLEPSNVIQPRLKPQTPDFQQVHVSLLYDRRHKYGTVLLLRRVRNNVIRRTILICCCEFNGCLFILRYPYLCVSRVIHERMSFVQEIA